MLSLIVNMPANGNYAVALGQFGASGGTAYQVSVSGNCGTFNGAKCVDDGGSPMPAPGTFVLMGIGLAGLGYRRKKLKTA